MSTRGSPELGAKILEMAADQREKLIGAAIITQAQTVLTELIEVTAQRDACQRRIDLLNEKLAAIKSGQFLLDKARVMIVYQNDKLNDGIVTCNQLEPPTEPLINELGRRQLVENSTDTGQNNEKTV